MRRAAKAILLALTLYVIACEIAKSAQIVDRGTSDATQIENVGQFLEKLRDGSSRFSIDISKVEDPADHNKRFVVLRARFDRSPVFDTANSSIRLEFFPLLETLAASLRDDNSKALFIIGHTDSRGSEKYNHDLSLRRALSVANELKKIGIGATSISVVGLGKSVPLRPNNSSENMSHNRRIEFFVAKDEIPISSLLNKSPFCSSSAEECSRKIKPIKIVANVSGAPNSDIGGAINKLPKSAERGRQNRLYEDALRELTTKIDQETVNLHSLQEREFVLNLRTRAVRSLHEDEGRSAVLQNSRRILERNILELEIRKLELEQRKRDIEQIKTSASTSNSSQPGSSPQSSPLETFFPWPPPPASARKTMPAEIFGDRARFESIGRVADFLEAALRHGGFDDWSYFSLRGEDAGFGLVSHMEQISPTTGHPLSATSRWADRAYAAATMSFLDSLLTIKRPIGHYRAFVFIFSAVQTPENPPNDPKPDSLATLALARQWTARGKRYLPSEIRSLPMGDNHRLTVRIYEFEQQDKGNSELVKSSAWTVMQHLELAGIDLGIKP
jgi:outer membrane protein OmpA-like peptidoglycan-associated protein